MKNARRLNVLGELEEFDHYKNDAVRLPPRSIIEVEDERYVVTNFGKAYSTKHRAFLANLIYCYDFDVIWRPDE